MRGYSFAYFNWIILALVLSLFCAFCNFNDPLDTESGENNGDATDEDSDNDDDTDDNNEDSCSQERTAALDAELSDQIESLSIYGASAAVGFADGELCAVTAGNSTDSEFINPKMLFGIGSVTKTFTASLILKLVEEGYLFLDSPLDNFLPSHEYIDSSITIRQLLDHTSGIYNYTTQQWMDDSVENREHLFTHDEILAALGEPDFEPGTSWNYSNTNYYLLGMIVEEILGEDAPKAVRTWLLEPFNLKNTFWGVGDDIPEHLDFAHAWSPDRSGIDATLYSRNSMYSAAFTAGAMISTPRDLVMWAQYLYGGEVLEPHLLNEMTTFNAFGYGLGCGLITKAGRQGWGHGGGMEGYATSFYYEPKSGISVSVQVNEMTRDVEMISDALFGVALSLE